MMKLTFVNVNVLLYKLKDCFDYIQIIENFVFFNSTNKSIIINFNLLEVSRSNEDVFDFDELFDFVLIIQLNHRFFFL